METASEQQKDDFYNDLGLHGESIEFGMVSSNSHILIFNRFSWPDICCKAIELPRKGKTRPLSIQTVHIDKKSFGSPSDDVGYRLT